MSNTIRFAAIGLNHNHIYGQVDLLVRAGAELAMFYAAEADLAAIFQHRYPQAQQATNIEAILHNESLQLITTATIPDQRAELCIAAMQHGKDVLSDKPGFTTLAQLDSARSVQAETGRIYAICYSEHFENAATERALEVARSGAIGRVVQTVGLGPHRANIPSRPDWFFEHKRYGGILVDIAAHQYEQFLAFTGATKAEVVASQVANHHHPQFPGLEDFGDAMLRGWTNDGAAVSGYLRTDWFTPDGLLTWGDTRLTVLGTEGFLEVRKNCDLAGRAGGNHLFVVDRDGTHYIDCADAPLPFGPRLLDDIRNRTQTAASQAHMFLAAELALRAELAAQRLG